MNGKLIGQVSNVTSLVLTAGIVYVVSSHGDYTVGEALLLAVSVVGLNLSAMIYGHMSGVAIAIKAMNPGAQL
jgi:uncharacterized membrane protein